MSNCFLYIFGMKKSFGLDPLSRAKKILLPKKSLLIYDSRETPIPIFLKNGEIDCKDLSPETNYAVYMIFIGMLYSGPGAHQDLQNNEHHDLNMCTILIYYRRFQTDMSSDRPLQLIYKKCKKCVWQESQLREDRQWEVKSGNFSTCF